ncbi:Histidine kinase [Chitinophaga sp. YR573]|nr:Histidine kinase [Chitinophaga sp. YR573]
MITSIFEDMISISSHISFPKVQWIVWSFVLLLLFGIYLQNDSFAEAATYAIITTLFYAIVIYGNAMWLIPRLYKKEKRTAYILLIILFLIVVTIGRLQLQNALYLQFFSKGKPMPTKDTSYYVMYYLSYFLSSILIFIFSIAFHLSIEYFRVREQQQLLQKRTAEAELKLLKSQVQPHFLFNTLNNIYFVAQRESPDTAVLLERLSNIMRYFVDEGTKDLIPLTTEINFIYDYIHLEKLRMRHPLQVQFDIHGEPDSLLIPPMLLIPLIENVFKHGIDKRYENNFLVAIITISEESLDAVISNRIYRSELKSGSGIMNLTSRLQLLYGSRYIFETSEKDALFYAHLNIPL